MLSQKPPEADVEVICCVKGHRNAAPQMPLLNLYMVVPADNSHGMKVEEAGFNSGDKQRFGIAAVDKIEVFSREPNGPTHDSPPWSAVHSQNPIENNKKYHPSTVHWCDKFSKTRYACVRVSLDQFRQRVDHFGHVVPDHDGHGPSDTQFQPIFKFPDHGFPFEPVAEEGAELEWFTHKEMT